MAHFYVCGNFSQKVINVAQHLLNQALPTGKVIEYGRHRHPGHTGHFGMAGAANAQMGKHLHPAHQQLLAPVIRVHSFTGHMNIHGRYVQ